MTSSRRATWLGVSALALLPLIVVGLSLDAAARRHARDAEAPRLARALVRLPTSDLALSGGARWLRSLSTEEPWAAFSDGPAIPDPDPAGGVVAPPVEVWATHVQDARISRGSARRTP